MATDKADTKSIWWTTIIVTLSTVIIGSALRLIEQQALNKSAYDAADGIFSPSQPNYFPLLFLVIVFAATYVTVVVYRALLPQLPSNWILRGLLVGGVLFLIGDLPKDLLLGYSIVVPPVESRLPNVYPTIARGAAFGELVNRLISGCVLAYCYWRFSPEWEQRKQK